MGRWAPFAALTLSSVLLVQLGGAAFAATPIPKPKPDRTLALDPQDPQAALSRFVDAANPALGPSVSAYAPSQGAGALASQTEEVALYLVGKLSEDGGPIADGMTWRVFRAFPGESGELPLVRKVTGGDLDLRLKPGRYIVNASYGRASVSRTLDLQEVVTSETFVLDAGGLLLTATLDAEADALDEDVAFELYRLDGEDRTKIGKIAPGEVARLAAGAYHVVSRYGTVNAVRSADVIVEPGMLTRVSLRHQAGTVRLKLVRDDGGQAIADTAWTVYTDDGEPVYERVGAHANVTLAAGEYAVVAKHRDAEFSRSFTVESGGEADIVVLARRL